MGFWSDLTNMWKGFRCNALVSHLEFAYQKYHPTDLSYVSIHLELAMKAMAKMRQSKADSAITVEGWTYIAEMAKRLTVALESNGADNLAKDSRAILEYALQHQ